MKIAIFIKGEIKPTLFSNEDLKEGDDVWPLVAGYTDGTSYFVCKIEKERIEDPPHRILNLKHSTSKPYEVSTSSGYGPRESYFKRIS